MRKIIFFIMLIATTSLFAQNYTVQSIPYDPPAAYASGDIVGIFVDDIYSSIIALPFDFEFYGNTFNSFIIGSNGNISFDVDMADGFNQWNITDNIPTQDFLPNSIFGVFHDLQAVSDGAGEIRQGVIGNAPNRIAYINFNTLAHYICNDLLSTTQIALYEGSNNIEIYIQDKPVCTSWNDGRAILGIQNENATAATVPAGRNGLDAPWNATNEGWLFSTLNDVSLGDDFETCNATAVLNFDQGDDTLTYQWSLNGSEIDDANNPTYIATQTGFYEVVATNGTTTFTDDINITFNENPEIASAPSTIFIDEGDGDNTAIFDLTINEAQMLGDQNPSLISFNYYITQIDCDLGTNPIANATNYQNTLNPETIYVRLDNVNTGCFVCTNFLIQTDGALDLETATLNNLNIYPNPAKDVINVELNAEAFAEILIRDIQGREILISESGAAVTSVDVSVLKNGVYFLIVKANGRSVAKRFIKK